MSTTTIAAAYIQTHTELHDAVAKAKKLPDSQVQQGLGVLASQLTDPTAQKAIGDEIKDLSVRAVALVKTFALIDGLISHQDAEKAVIADLAKKWSALYQDYKQLLVKSSEVAKQAHDVADSFSSKFLPSLTDDTVSASDKAASMQNYHKLIDENSQSAHGLAQGFAKLQQDVAAFLVSWPSWDTLDILVKTSDDEIAALQNTVIDLLTSVSNLQLIFTYGAIPPTTGVTSILGCVIPSFWTSALATAIGPLIDQSLLAKIKSEAPALKPELSAKREQRAGIENLLSPQQQLQAYLVDVPTDLDGIVKPLSALTTIWDSIRSDLGVIQQTAASSASDPNAKALLVPRLQVFAGLYKMVAGCFAGYQTIVDLALAHAS
ncbi:hypothetical protein EUX98_g4992 [Antrodiella citrinella]|uniref:Uncharacterized protein n=1 Tax=Antrodiella citrinella TaxID=2447956 RepID=A0A4S4N0I9_9APHY|nr:hypothetical protein EUX98_g4992 [Antrodiella citrinella]